MKLKLDHNQSGFSEAFGINKERRKALQERIKETIIRGFMDQSMEKISQGVEFLCEEAKTKEELVYSTYVFVEKYHEIKSEFKQFKSMLKSSKSKSSDDEDDLLARASSMSKKLGKLAN